MLESLLAGETLDKKVETKEEEPMSECQVRLWFVFLPCLIFSASLSLLYFVVLCVLFLCQAVCLFSSVCITLCVCASLSVSAFVSLGVCVLAVTQTPAALTTPSWHRVCVCVCVI